MQTSIDFVVSVTLAVGFMVWMAYESNFFTLIQSLTLTLN